MPGLAPGPWSPNRLMNRKPRYLAADHASKERWLISYTDFITVLMVLFVAIAAQGYRATQQLGAAPTAQRMKASAKPQPAETRAPESSPESSPEPSKVLKEADQKLRQQGLDSRLEKRGLVISLPQAVLFPSGEDHIIPAALPMISQIADVLTSVPNKVALVGHADSVPIHNKRFQSNWELSAARSLSLLQVLSTRYGIAESRLSVQSYGAYNPKEPNDTEAGRAENRRVEILLLDESAQ
jgi:chemotaxis protein MotB